MNNQNNNQTNLPSNDKEFAKNMSPPEEINQNNNINIANTDSSLEVKDSLKEFNSIPLDTPPAPISIDDNLDPNYSLPNESLKAKENNPQPILSTPDLPQPQSESLSDSNVTPEPETSITPEPETSITPEPETSITPEPETNVIPEPETSITPEPETSITPEPEINVIPELKVDSNYNQEPVPTIQTETNLSNLTSQNPEDIKQKIEEVLSYNSADSIVNSQSKQSKTSSFLKAIFFISLIIFILIVAGLAYFIFNPSLKSTPEIITTPTDYPTPPVQSDISCELNGSIYALDQSFPSADGCNTCTCVSADNINCTDNDCDIVNKVSTPAATSPSKSATITPKMSTESSNLKTSPTITKKEN